MAMVRRRTLTLTAEQRAELEDLRDQSPTSYLRERAAALLKIADGASPHAVALQGLFKPRDPDTIYAWLNAYEREGVQGLIQKPRRSRKFSP
jgi:hypothetical protein